jgi:O-antigen/teichoic acid export membrane protein
LLYQSPGYPSPTCAETTSQVKDQMKRIRQFAAGRGAQTIVDQVMVSGSNFVTGVILVRGLGLAEFGRFTIAYVVLLLANSIQLSFISSPMITLGALCSDPAERRRFVRGVFGVQLIFCAIALLAAVTGTIVYLALQRGTASGSLLLPFGAAVVLYLMQDWLRRYYFTVGRAAASVWNDAVSYLGQVLLLLALMLAHKLTMESAFWVIAITSGIAFTMGALIERLGCSRRETAEAWQRTRGTSIDLGIANQLQWLVYQGAMLIGASVAGPVAAGGVRATQNVIGPVNIAYQAMENIVPIRAAEEMRRGGISRVAAFLFRFGSVGFLALLVLFSLGSLLSERFLAFFYGQNLRPYATVLNLQMLYFLLAWPVRQFTFLFRTIKNTKPILISSVVAAVISLALVYPLVSSLGAIGIVMAAVAGQLGNLLYLVLSWIRVSSTANPEVLSTLPS